ncbi:peptidoglycan DD-metalloendopeptidase family protein [Pontibacterium granulatum]|uniref:murein hydrolase activator EnvC family protein n=1 Tax=Pontibacterium granulatum TaxID=2036029 RepID=UPI00249B3D43|nr:peptidoglycan DD-metalloendopeptidase family protein [Pontibacterium granulatum]MDI3325718.1 peptidoglycan DD-metalloendopeptidase family protein [Pontibacterium granulatum]
MTRHAGGGGALSVFARICLPLLLLFSLTSVAYAADGQASEAQIRKLKKDIASLQKQLSKSEGEASSLSSQLRKSELSIARISKQIHALDKQLSRLGAHAGSLEGKRDALRKELNKRAVSISQQLREQYKLGEQPWLQVLLMQKDPEELSRMMRYFGAINSELAGQIKSFKIRLAQLNNTETELSDTEQKMVVKRRQLKLEKNDLEQNRAERAKTLAAIRGEIKSDQQRLTRLKADRERMEKVLKEVRRAIDKVALDRDGQAFRELKGKLPWPVSGKIRRSFGSVSDNIRYDGVWIATKAGRDVKAAHHGRVVFSDWLRGHGLVMIIDHGGNYLSLYGYNETLQREVGDWVSAGETIATVGASGGRSEPGLYFAIRYKGKATNPKRWLAKQ